MKRLSIRIPQDVEKQILEQVLFIAQDSIDNALGWEVRLRAALDALGSFHGHAVDKDATQRLGKTLHKMVFERTYLIHYRVDEDAGEVVVVNFVMGHVCRDVSNPDTRPKKTPSRTVSRLGPGTATLKPEVLRRESPLPRSRSHR